MRRLEGEIAIVTGGGRGFGRSIAVGLAAEGALVCVVSRTRDQLQETTTTIRSSGGSACYVVADLTRPSHVEKVVETARKEFVGAPTIVILAAGVPGPFGPLWEMESESWWNAMTLHIRAPALLLRQVLPIMVKQKKGRVVLVSSRAGNGAHPFLSSYCVGKAAQTRLAAVVDCETRPFDVRVFAIEPGLAFTQMARDTVDDPAARRFLPDMVQRLSTLSESKANDSVLASCANRCVELVSGRYDVLGGRFLDSEVDLNELLNLEKRRSASTVSHQA